MRNDTLRIYDAPEVEVISVLAADILTLSAGFDGDEHEFELPMP